MFEINFVYILLFSIAAFAASGIVSFFAKRKRIEFILSTIFIILIILSSIFLLISNSNIVVLNALHFYAFSLIFIILFSLAMLLVNTLSYNYSRDYPALSFLLSLSLAGVVIVSAADSVISIFLGLELIAITTTFMILFEGKKNTEAAVKLFILSSLSIAVFSFALVLMFPFNSQLALTPVVLNSNVNGIYLILLSIILFIAAFGFDASLFPFNLWVPDVYEGAPTYVTSMLAGINKKVAFVALIEVFFLIFLSYHQIFSSVFVVLSVLTMFFGNLLALSQKSVKRMFAYSSISQAGYILIGIAAFSQYGLSASIFYIFAHSFMIIGAFAIVLWLESKNIRTIDDYAALNSKNNFAAISLTIFMLSMAGIPPFIEFAGKFLLFSSAIDSNLLILAILAVVNSFISIYYYGRLMSAMYTRKENKSIKIDPFIASVVLVALLVVIIFGIYPQPLISAATAASRAVFGM